MVRVAPVQLQYNPKTLWFDPGELELTDGNRVIVSTERGTEYGVCSGGIIEVEEEDIEALNSALKPVLRIATEEDLEQVERMRVKSAEALPLFKQLAAEENENMHPVMVEYLFDGEKAVFFFESEERIDFRDLVRKLASEFKVRVDMRQIGVRDEARMVGGLGHCGQELCCRRLGGEFNPVSIRMAKEQDLSLNPTKISGACGRLMCCLRYEFDAYKDFKSRAPKQGAKIDTPAGSAKVIELNVPKETVTVLLEEDNKRVTFPLSAMDAPEDEEGRPCSIGDVFEEYANPDPFESTLSFSLFNTSSFTQEDKLGVPEARHNTEEEAEEETQNKNSRRRRRRKSGSSQSQEKAATTENKKAEAKSEEKAEAGHSSRRRRRRNSSNSSVVSEGAVRPGQKSSSLSGSGTPAQQKNSQAGNRQDAHQPGSHRTSRRRTHRTGGSPNES